MERFLDGICCAAEIFESEIYEALVGKGPDVQNQKNYVATKLSQKFKVVILQCPCFQTGLGNFLFGTPLSLPPTDVLVELKSEQARIEAIYSEQNVVVTSEGSIRIKAKAGATVTGSFFGTKTGETDVVFASSVGDIGETMMFVWDDKTVLQSAKESEHIFLVGRTWMNHCQQSRFADASELGNAMTVETKHPLVLEMQDRLFAEIERIRHESDDLRPVKRFKGMNRLSSAANAGWLSIKVSQASRILSTKRAACVHKMSRVKRSMYVQSWLICRFT